MLTVRPVSIFLLLCFVTMTWAQDIRGRIAGQVTDSGGAVVARAELQAIESGTGVRTRALTNEAGLYELPYLAPGVYSLSVSVPGFKRFERKTIEVRVGERLQIDAVLEVGEVTESVTVTGENQLIEASSATIGQVVDRKRLLELPLPGGNSLSLARLAQGVQNFGAPNHPSLGPAVEVLSSISVNGVRPGNTEFTIDGTPAMWGTNAAVAPPAEMVAEFKVQTATYDAALGRAPGGNINLVLRSGTNQFHGMVYHFHNNQVLTAMDLFQRQLLAGGPQTDERRAQANPRNILNRFGTNFSGPLVLPKLYDGHNKTFWIYGFEGLTRPGIERGNSFYTVPTLAQRKGDFSGLLPLGAAYQVYDPATITAAPGGRFARLPFGGNVIPASRLDATAQKINPLWLEPNAPGTTDGRNNYQRLPGSYNEYQSHTAKVDHNFSNNHRAFLRYNRWYQLFSSGDLLGNGTNGTDRFRRNWGFGADDVYVISPSFLMNLRWGFARTEQTFIPLASNFDLAGLGFSSQLINSVDPAARYLTQIAPAGIQAISNAARSTTTANYHTWAADFTKSLSRHSLRFGAEYRLYREHTYNFALVTPQLTFGNTFTRGPLDNSPVAPIGQGYASFLLGLPTDGQQNVVDSLAEQSKTSAFYVQDDWRISNTLTVNAGLRYDYDSPATERFNRSIRGYDFGTSNPVEAQARINYAAAPIPELPVANFRATGGLQFAGVGGQPRGLWEADRNNFAPRLGIAWQMRPRTVLRTGYGIYFVPLGVDRTTVNQSGFSLRNSLVASTDNGLTFSSSLSNPFPGGLAQPLRAAGGLSTDVGRSISYFKARPKNGYQQRFSLSLQHQVGKWLLEGTYVGNRGTSLQVTRPLNPIPNEQLSRSGERDQGTIDRLSRQVNNPFFPLPLTDIAGRTVAASQLLRPYPHYSGLAADLPIGYSWYHSLQTRVERRFSQGFTVNLGHTWSKLMEANSYRNGGDAQLEEVISDLDRTHRFTGSGIWEIPVGKGRPLWNSAGRFANAVVGDWQLQAVWQRNTGAPISFGNLLLTGDIRSLPAPTQTLDTWFNTGIFNRVPAQQLASNVRTLSTRFSGVRIPGQESWDISALKNFRVTERVRLQLRGELLNAMNRSNLAGPNTDPTNTLFGRITATSGFPRQVHIGLKATF